MKRLVFTSLFILGLLDLSYGQTNANSKAGEGLNTAQKETKVLITTDYGNIIVKLYNETPKHRDNFKKLAKEGYYTGLLFHRVMENFMIQGGDPDSKWAEPGEILGNGGPGYTVPSEFHPDLFHKRGALAAARTNNPEKASSGSQFYIVQGRSISENEILNYASEKLIDYSEEQKLEYLERGGTPQLDMEYTVFGKMIYGGDVLDKIASSATDTKDRPIDDVRILKVKMIN